MMKIGVLPLQEQHLFQDLATLEGLRHIEFTHAFYRLERRLLLKDGIQRYHSTTVVGITLSAFPTVGINKYTIQFSKMRDPTPLAINKGRRVIEMLPPAQGRAEVGGF